MNSKARNYRGMAPLAAAFAVLLALGMGACGAAPAAAPTPTRTPKPAATAVPRPTEIPLVLVAPTAPATAVPPATSTPVPTPTEAPTAAPTATTAPATATTRPPAPTAQPVVVQPTARPPAPTAPPPPPAPADPCAGIGGDGCKWRVTGGPSFGANGGGEIKLQLMFLHSGVQGGQPQGSYFVVLMKDGQKLPIPDTVRSIAKVANQGSLGKYNYEYALGRDKLPGNSVAGHYTLWVLDGNGERDSRNIEFDLPANSGLIWIQFDQA